MTTGSHNVQIDASDVLIVIAVVWRSCTKELGLVWWTGQAIIRQASLTLIPVAQSIS